MNLLPHFLRSIPALPPRTLFVKLGQLGTPTGDFAAGPGIPRPTLDAWVAESRRFADAAARSIFRVVATLICCRRGHCPFSHVDYVHDTRWYLCLRCGANLDTT